MNHRFLPFRSYPALLIAMAAALALVAFSDNRGNPRDVLRTQVQNTQDEEPLFLRVPHPVYGEIAFTGDAVGIPLAALETLDRMRLSHRYAVAQ